MNMKILPLLILFTILVIPTHADSTQQYNKIYLNPFYVNSISAGGSVLFSTVLNPPDRISSVTSAIVGFNSQINGQTQNFTLRINNQSCNPSSYAVATAFSTTGNVQFYFDCTNVIQTAKTYQINLTSSVATGAITGWLETTYMNNPSGNVKYVGGTDYYQGERATVFLQLQDASGQSVNNASCNFNMYNSTNPLTTPIFYKQPMVFRGADGIYYYQFSTNGYPTGVYLLDAECTYIYNSFYYNTGTDNYPNIITNSGTFQGGSAYDLNSGSDMLYMSWTSTPINLTLTWSNISSNVTQLSMIWLGESDSIRTVTFYVYNWTSGTYIQIGSVTLTSGGGNPPTGYDDLFTVNFPNDITNFINSTGSSRIQLYTTGAQRLNINWFTLKAYRNTTYVSEVKGSSEVHIYPTYVPINETSLSTAIWNNTNKTLTNYNLTEISTQLNQINQTVTQNNILLLAINSTVTTINSYLNGFITTTLNNIYTLLTQVNSTVNTINSKDFSPNVTFNGTILVNTTNVTVILNVTNTTVIVNNTQEFPVFNITLNTTVFLNQTNTTIIINQTNVIFTPIFNVTNITVIVNTTQVNLENITTIFNVTNTTVVVNTTLINLDNITVMINTTNTTVVVNTTQINLNNVTVIENITNTTVVINTTNTTVIVNTTLINLNNITVIENLTNVTFTPVYNITLNTTLNITTIDNITNMTTVVNITLIPIINITTNVTVLINQTNITNIFEPIFNITNTTVVINTTMVNLDNVTVIINTTNTTTLINFTDLNNTAQEILTLSQQINTTTQANNNLLLQINATVTAISTYLNGFITSTLNNIYILLGQVNQTTIANNEILVSINNSLVPNTVWIW